MAWKLTWERNQKLRRRFGTIQGEKTTPNSEFRESNRSQENTPYLSKRGALTRARGKNSIAEPKKQGFTGHKRGFSWTKEISRFHSSNLNFY